MSRSPLATVTVSAEHDYPVHIGHGAVTAIADEPALRGRRFLVVTSESVQSIAADVCQSIGASPAGTLVVPDGETAKTVQTAADCWDAFADAGIGRGDIIVSVGGGTVTDLAGFAAATWMRGIDVLHVPTTTAAMVDAAIGGKTGVNTTRGKNLVGSFHSPVAVYCDMDFLASLPQADHTAGLAEALKCGFIADSELLRLFREHGSALRDADHPALPEIVRRAVTVKADVVAADFTESASGIGRELLNYGHTFGHALESLHDYTLRHGDAVAMGMVLAAELSQVLGLAPQAMVEEHYELVAQLGLPARHRVRDFGSAIELMGRDKKARGGVIRFILLRGPGDAVAVDGVDVGDLTRAMTRCLDSEDR